jgi:hypothetical protein
MSEKHIPHIEQAPPAPSATAEHVRKPETHTTVEAEPTQAIIEQLEHRARSQATTSTEYNNAKTEQPPAEQPMGSYSRLKYQAYTRTLAQVQSRLKRPEKTLSKVIHQPIVEAVSEASGKTVARPSGLLGGGICALLGSLLLLYLARRHGFTYNYSIFIIFLVGGYVVGLLLETLFKLAHSHKS